MHRYYSSFSTSTILATIFTFTHFKKKCPSQNAIREKTQALNYLRLSSRIDAVAARLESAIRMKQVTGAMAGIVTGMDTALKDMDVEKVGTACGLK